MLGAPCCVRVPKTPFPGDCTRPVLHGHVGSEGPTSKSSLASNCYKERLSERGEGDLHGTVGRGVPSDCSSRHIGSQSRDTCEGGGTPVAIGWTAEVGVRPGSSPPIEN
jgi:hypothetical protein